MRAQRGRGHVLPKRYSIFYREQAFFLIATKSVDYLTNACKIEYN